MAEDGLGTLFSGESLAQQILLSNALSDLDRKFIVHGSCIWTIRTLITASSAKFHGKMLTQAIVSWRSQLKLIVWSDRRGVTWRAWRVGKREKVRSDGLLYCRRRRSQLCFWRERSLRICARHDNCVSAIFVKFR